MEAPKLLRGVIDGGAGAGFCLCPPFPDPRATLSAEIGEFIMKRNPHARTLLILV